MEIKRIYLFRKIEEQVSEFEKLFEKILTSNSKEKLDMALMFSKISGKLDAYSDIWKMCEPDDVTEEEKLFILKTNLWDRLSKVIDSYNDVSKELLKSIK